MKYREYDKKPAKTVSKLPPANTQEFKGEKVIKFSESDTTNSKVSEASKKNKSKLAIKSRLSKLKTPRIKRPKRPKTSNYNSLDNNRKRQIYVIVGIVIVILVFGVLIIVKNNGSNDKKPQVAGSSSVKLSFTPLVAPGKTFVPDPEGKRDTGSYADKIGLINIRVSEQPLPNSFKPDVEAKLAEFAKYNYYNQQLNVGNIKVYTGMSIKGVQSVVFTKNNILIFIRADQKVADKSLTDYINSLK